MASPLQAGPMDSESLCQEFRARGFIVLRELFDADTMALLDAESRRLWADERQLISRNNLRCRFMAHHETGEPLFECFDPVIDIAPGMETVAKSERILRVLASLYGCQAHLFKDKMIFKPPGALGYPLHQDFISWPEFPQSFLTVLIPIDAATEENGCTVVYPGYHKSGLLTPADGKFHPVPRELVDERDRVPLVLRPGDVAIFDGFTPHESHPNRSSMARRQLYLSYNADHDGGDQRDAHYKQFHQWLRDKYSPSAHAPWFFA